MENSSADMRLIVNCFDSIEDLSCLTADVVQLLYFLQEPLLRGYLQLTIANERLGKIINWRFTGGSNCGNRVEKEMCRKVLLIKHLPV